MLNHDDMYLPNDKLNNIEELHKEMRELLDFMMKNQQRLDENKQHEKEVKDFLRRYL